MSNPPRTSAQLSVDAYTATMIPTTNLSFRIAVPGNVDDTFAGKLQFALSAVIDCQEVEREQRGAHPTFCFDHPRANNVGRDYDGEFGDAAEEFSYGMFTFKCFWGGTSLWPLEIGYGQVESGGGVIHVASNACMIFDMEGTIDVAKQIYPNAGTLSFDEDLGFLAIPFETMDEYLANLHWGSYPRFQRRLERYTVADVVAWRSGLGNALWPSVGPKFESVVQKLAGHFEGTVAPGVVYEANVPSPEWSTVTVPSDL